MNKEMEQQWRTALSDNTRHCYDNNFFGDINIDGWMVIEDSKKRRISLPFLVIGYALFLDICRLILVADSELYTSSEFALGHSILAKIVEFIIYLPAIVFTEKFISSHPILFGLVVICSLNLSGAFITAAAALQSGLLKFWCGIVPYIIIFLFLIFLIIAEPNAIADVIFTMVIFVLIPYRIGCRIGNIVKSKGTVKKVDE